MITIRFDGKEHNVFQFGDLGIGDLFGVNKSVYVKKSKGGDYIYNAIDLRRKRFEKFSDDEVVEPISLEWEGSEEDAEIYGD